MRNKTWRTPRSPSTPTRYHRREVLRLLGITALVAPLAACRVTPPQPLPSCLKGSIGNDARIDAHIHIFNGTDLQIAGFLKTSVAGEYPSVAGLLQLIADPLQTFVWKYSPKAAHELNRLNKLTTANAVHSFSSAPFATALQADRAETAAQYSEFLRQQMQREDVRGEMLRLLRMQPLTSTQLPRAFAAPPDAKSARALARRIDRESGIPIFDYLERYFSYRYVNFCEVAQVFTCQTKPTVDVYVALMVDFDEPLAPGTETPSRIRDQTTVVSKICELSQGRLFALAPYCPIKDVARHGASLVNVLEAWKKPGFAGTKIYPPMGFKAYGNGDARDAALARFYHQCIQHDAAVMAHAEPSLCVYPGPCTTPGFEGWSDALEYVFATERAPLRAALGHFGGIFGDKPESALWPTEFHNLMQRPAGQNLYADLAYSSEILQPANQPWAIARLTALLRTSGSVLAQRLMYGSDWLMLGLESSWQQYSAQMESVISRVEKTSGSAGFDQRFFSSNARAWLGLNKPDSLASRNRVVPHTH